MIDIVIPLRNDSNWDNNEIRYCLRSVEKYLTDIRDVYIVGHKPKFLTNVKHIPMRDPSPYVTVNIKNKVLRVCEEYELSDNFLFMNDDHYLMDWFDIRFLYYSGTIRDAFANAKNSIYRLILKNTMDHFNPGWGFYDVHTPVVFHKRVFTEVMNDPIWDSTPFGFAMKTFYCHRTPMGWYDGRLNEIKDGKIRDPKSDWADIAYLVQTAPVISSSDIVGKGMVKFLDRLFPYKSKYEI